jgi:anti-sigma regulatory factor (Ser/Thr protein kinase)
VGHFYLGGTEPKLYCLNEAACEFQQQGVPLTGPDLARQPLVTLDGQHVAPADLPHLRAWQTNTAQEASFLMVRDTPVPQVLHWQATPVRATSGARVGVLASLALPPPGPDLEELAGLAHDLRTPLHTIRLLIPLLQMAQGQGLTGGIIDRLRSAVDRAVAVGLEVVEFCKDPYPDAAPAVRRWLALAPLLERLAEEQSPAALRKKIGLEVELEAARGVEFHTDEQRFGRLVINLLANAVRYTSTGRVRLAASWREGGILMLTVEDTGAGFAAEEQDAIFQPFQRGRSGHEGDSSGSGVGLAVVDRLLGDLGLTLEVASEPGKGSRFDMLLPAEMLRKR